MKGELGRKIMTEFGSLRPKTYSYLTDGNDINKKGKRQKKCDIKQKLRFEDYKNFLEANQPEKKKNKPPRKKKT